LAAKLLTHFKKKITALTLVPSSGGCFELEVDGKPFYSKLETGEFPTEQAVVSQLEKSCAGNA
jgi:selenoprotein W-related protein